MPRNHLEDLAAEWYEFRGYFVRRNVHVGKRAMGGYECELDIVALHPENAHLVQIEPSMDSDSWARREQRYTKKFEAGRKHIPSLFAGMSVPPNIEQIALFVYGSNMSRKSLAGGTVLMIGELMQEIYAGLRDRRVQSAAVPESYPLLRTLQFAASWWPVSEVAVRDGKALKGAAPKLVAPNPPS